MSGSRQAVLAGVLLTIFVALLGAALLAWPDAALAAHITERVSLSSADTQSSWASDRPTISGDGRYVAFQSMAADLVPGDTNNRIDIFVRDRVTGVTERVSVSSAEVQADEDSMGACISADGRYVAFESLATNLVSGDTGYYLDVFVRDRVLGTTVRVSRSTAGTQGNNSSALPSISADGRYVAFSSLATNLVSGDTNVKKDIFVRDLVGGTTSRVSVNSAEIQSNGDSDRPSISADGRYVAFSSLATNLVSGDTNTKTDIFVRDRTLGLTERASVSSDETQGDSNSDKAAISADGRFVAFTSEAGDLVTGDTGGWTDVFVRDRVVGTTERASVSTSEVQANDDSSPGGISANGRYIAFYSYATNLAWEDTNDNRDIFLRDRETGSTTMLSVATDFEQGNDQSDNPAVSADGRCIAFSSEATNLVGDDTNDMGDIFVISDHLLLDSPPITYSGFRGSDRYFTAILLSQAAFPDPLPAGSGVVLAPGTTFPEALCGAPLAAAYGGPVLLTPTTGLHPNVRAELQRLDPDYVFVIGLSATVRTNVQTALGAGSTVTAIGTTGGNIYTMSRNVANALEAKVGDMSGAVGLVTIGSKFPDALGLSPLACAKLWPIILTDQTSGAYPFHAQAVGALADLGIDTTIKVGTYSTAPAGVTSLANLSGVAPAGQSHLARYYTNANVAAWADGNAGLDFTHTAFATGDKFPDALASGPYLAQDEGILLLSPLNGPVPDPVTTLLYAHRDEVDELTFIACIEPVITTVKGLLP